MGLSETSALIVELRDIARAIRRNLTVGVKDVGAIDRAADALAALTTGQEIDAPSVREAIGEVLADMEAVIDGVPVASDLVALQEITDAAIRAAISPPSRTAKRTGYETVGHAVGEHSQTIRATAAITTPQELPKAEREARCPYSHQLDYCTKCGWTRPTPTPREGDAREPALNDATEKLDDVILAHVLKVDLPIPSFDNRRRALCTCGESLIYEGEYIALSWHRDHLADAILAAFPVLTNPAAHDAEVAAKAWDEGYWQGINGHTGPGNPYSDCGAAEYRKAVQ